MLPAERHAPLRDDDAHGSDDARGRPADTFLRPTYLPKLSGTASDAGRTSARTGGIDGRIAGEKSARILRSCSPDDSSFLPEPQSFRTRPSCGNPELTLPRISFPEIKKHWCALRSAA